MFIRFGKVKLVYFNRLSLFAGGPEDEAHVRISLSLDTGWTDEEYLLQYDAQSRQLLAGAMSNMASAYAEKKSASSREWFAHLDKLMRHGHCLRNTERLFYLVVKKNQISNLPTSVYPVLRSSDTHYWRKRQYEDSCTTGERDTTRIAAPSVTCGLGGLNGEIVC